MFNFCDLMCRYAEIPTEGALDGSGSCMTFTALYCNLKNMPVHKNMPCKHKSMKGQDCEKAEPDP